MSCRDKKRKGINEENRQERKNENMDEERHKQHRSEDFNLRKNAEIHQNFLNIENPRHTDIHDNQINNITDKSNNTNIVMIRDITSRPSREEKEEIQREEKAEKHDIELPDLREFVDIKRDRKESINAEKTKTETNIKETLSDIFQSISIKKINRAKFKEDRRDRSDKSEYNEDFQSDITDFNLHSIHMEEEETEYIDQEEMFAKLFLGYKYKVEKQKNDDDIWLVVLTEDVPRRDFKTVSENMIKLKGELPHLNKGFDVFFSKDKKGWVFYEDPRRFIPMELWIKLRHAILKFERRGV
ncbi:MAG: hypothetical protein GF364_15070 [Candidatus Lokiarchaeota archaeon]|nr:hypothetical protein [Candidatus Lokiarchaeota archaeon]